MTDVQTELLKENIWEDFCIVFQERSTLYHIFGKWGGTIGFVCEGLNDIQYIFIYNSANINTQIDFINSQS